MYSYSDVYNKLNFGVATVIFFKKNGDIRVMLATRNVRTAALLHGYLGGELAGHDKNCSIKNGNIAVIDLILGEARMFNIDRVIAIYYHGEIETAEQAEAQVEEFLDYKNKYEANNPMKIDISML